MKSFFTSLTGISASLALLVVSQAAPLSNGSSCGVPGRTDDSTYLSVVGVQGTGVHPRQELRDLEKDTETWNLFLQAFARFQAMDQTDKASYFQVAGIHGAPFVEWDGVSGDGLRGYCPHASNVFSTWHRPYLALFEQVLHARAVDIANEYAEGEARTNALKVADKIRLPYWDWAKDPANSTEGVMPACLRRTTVTVTYPNGTAGEIPNPLLQYDFHPLKYDDFSALSEFEFKYWNNTIRLPLDGYALNASSRNDEANTRVGSQQPNNRDMLYKLLTVYQPWNQWSTKADGGNIGNVETLHDGLHNVFGLGNMGIVEVSAFDPVFWFHHCQIDRVMALFQARYPDTWVEAAVQPKATFTIPLNSTQDASSPLAPFHMNALGDMWTSATVRNWTAFGYTYPELVSNPSNDSLTLAINNLYKPQTQGLNNNNTITTLDVSNKSADATDWMVEVNMPSDIQISYCVRAFLGAPSSDPKNWPTDPNYIGQVASLSSPRMDSDVIVTASIVLTDALAQKAKTGELSSLDEASVTAWLQENFHWRIQAVDFSEIPRSSPPKGLNVTVLSVPVHLPRNDTDVPRWTAPFSYKPHIDGNPPVYNPNSPSNTTTDGPGFNGTTGGWNATSGEWSWNETDSSEISASVGGETPTVTPTPVTLPVSSGTGEVATASASSTASPASTSSASSAAVSMATSASSAAASSPATTAAPTSSAAAAGGETVEVTTLSNGVVITRTVTIVQTVVVTVS